MNKNYGLLMIHPTTLLTERLILRPWREEDLELFAKMNADLRVREYFPSVLPRETSDQHARFHMKYMQTHGWGLWAVEVPNVAKFIGFVDLEEVSFSAHFTPAVEIGWRLAFEYWGHGYATEGAQASLQYGFEVLKLKEIVAYTALDNKRSLQVMKKIGMSSSPSDDFDHPEIPVGSKVKHQTLYRLKHDEWKRSSLSCKITIANQLHHSDCFSSKKGVDFIGVGVGAVIFNEEGKVFIAKRGPKARNEVGKWEFPGGAVEFGETCEEAVVREIKEEFNIDIAVIELLGVVNHILPEEQQHWVSPSFIAKHLGGTPKITEPDKCLQFKWAKISEINLKELTKASRSNYLEFVKKYGETKTF